MRLIFEGTVNVPFRSLVRDLPGVVQGEPREVKVRIHAGHPSERDAGCIEFDDRHPEEPPRWTVMNQPDLEARVMLAAIEKLGAARKAPRYDSAEDQQRQFSPAACTHASTMRCAKDKGRRVVLPGPRELFLDIDGAEAATFACEAIERLRDAFEIVDYVWRPSPSGRDDFWHVTVTIGHDVTPAERIAMQAALGSDRMHEGLSLAAHRAGNQTPTVFFELPGPAAASSGVELEEGAF